jgi:hypothetical protein
MAVTAQSQRNGVQNNQEYMHTYKYMYIIKRVANDIFDASTPVAQSWKPGAQAIFWHQMPAIIVDVTRVTFA